MDMDFGEKLLPAEESFVHGADSLGQLLERLRSRISPVLIGDPEWERLLECAYHLPAAMAAFPFGFELPLHEPRPRADFGVSLIGGSRSATFFERTGRSEGADPSAARIARLPAETEAEDSPLRRIAGRTMLLEYDIDTTGRGTHPDPGVFLYPPEQALVDDRSQPRPRDLGVLVDAVASAAGRDLGAAQRRTAGEIHLAMGPDSFVQSAGAFPSRGSGLRLAARPFRTTDSLMAFLERAGWPGQHPFVASTVSRYEERGAFSYVGVHLDVQAHGAGPALGLSFYAPGAHWLKDIRYWLPLIDGIGEERLAVPEKLSSLVDSWSGTDTLFDVSGPFVLVQGIHHIKFTVIGDRIEQVKAYVFMLMLRRFLSQEKGSAA